MILISLVFGRGVYACGGISTHGFGGEIVYTLDSTNPMVCHLTLTLFFDINEALVNDSIPVNWGDGGPLDPVFATLIDTDLQALTYGFSAPVFRHTYYGSHTYSQLPAGGYYVVSPTNLYRVLSVNNINGGIVQTSQFYIQAQVGMDSTPAFAYKPPALQPVNIWFNGIGAFTAGELISAPSGDSLAFQFVTPLQSAGTPVPNYLYPSQMCSSNDSLSINNNDGTIRWENACFAQGIFDMAIVISTYRQGRLIGSVMRDQLLFAHQGPSAINLIEGAEGINVYPDPATNSLFVAMPGISEGNAELADVQGRVVIRQSITGSAIQNFNLEGLKAGIYLLNIRDGDEVVTRKVVKQ